MAVSAEWREYDVIVAGSGGAGSAAAQAAAEAGARVLVVAKDPVACSDTKIAEGIVTVRGSGDADDSETALAENLRIAGADLPDPRIAAAFAQDSRDAYDWMRRHGVRPDMESGADGGPDRPRALALPLGGHTRRRSVGHRNGGLAVGHAAWSAVAQNPRVDYLEDAWLLDIAVGGGEVAGGLVYHAAEGAFAAVRAPSVVIAAGGLGTLYFPKTDTMRGNTGDSYALALRAGAALVDMEQVQFLPFCMTHPPAYEGLCAGEPATAGYLGVLRDRDGRVILDGVMLRTRAECSAAIVRAVAQGRGTEHQLQSAIAGAERIFEVLDTEPSVTDRPRAAALAQAQGRVEFDRVHFAYEPGVPVLRDVSLCAEPGQTVALVGPTGAGKTTIVSLLSRFLDVTAGAIRIDGQDLRDLQQASWRRQLGIVLQDNYLFSGTVLENIRFGNPEATEAEAMDAARIANADWFIRRLPAGYASRVSERGHNFSEGQRQLIAIARAVLAQPNVLILDEATSSVDTRTEIHLQNALLELMKDRTAFVIAHRLNTIRHADVILFILDGRVVERGSHAELVARQGHYCNLYSSQRDRMLLPTA